MNQSAAFPITGISFSYWPIMNRFAVVPMQTAPLSTSCS